MARVTKVLASLEQPEGGWRVDEMMKATEEAKEESDRLEEERCDSEHERGENSHFNLARIAKIWAKGGATVK